MLKKESIKGLNIILRKKKLELLNILFVNLLFLKIHKCVVFLLLFCFVFVCFCLCFGFFLFCFCFLFLFFVFYSILFYSNSG